MELVVVVVVVVVVVFGGSTKGAMGHARAYGPARDSSRIVEKISSQILLSQCAKTPRVHTMRACARVYRSDDCSLTRDALPIYRSHAKSAESPSTETELRHKALSNTLFTLSRRTMTPRRVSYTNHQSDNSILFGEPEHVAYE